MSQITREVKLDPSVVPPLDPDILTLSDIEKQFLHEAITKDDEELREKILKVQKLYVFCRKYTRIADYLFRS